MFTASSLQAHYGVLRTSSISPTPLERTCHTQTSHHPRKPRGPRAIISADTHTFSPQPSLARCGPQRVRTMQVRSSLTELKAGDSPVPSQPSHHVISLWHNPMRAGHPPQCPLHTAGLVSCCSLGFWITSNQTELRHE